MTGEWIRYWGHIQALLKAIKMEREMEKDDPEHTDEFVDELFGFIVESPATHKVEND